MPAGAADGDGAGGRRRQLCSYAQLTIIVNLRNGCRVLIRPKSRAVAALLRRPATPPVAAGLIAVTLAVLLTAGCAADGRPGDGRPRVVAAFYPLQFVAERVGGGRVAVTGLASPGVEAHDLELTPSQVADLAGADLVLYLGGFQPAVDDGVRAHAAAALDVRQLAPGGGHGHEDGAENHAEDHTEDHTGDGHDHGPGDPHLWLDPDWMAGLAGAVAGALADLDPAGAAGYRAAADRLGADLAALDERYARGLADCPRREVVVSHAAFGHLAERYRLRQIAITGLSPEVEPTPRRLAEVIHDAEQTGATTIFFERLASPDIAELIAREVGATTAVLDPIEGLTPGSDGDYLSLMESNLRALRAGLGCR